MCRHLRFIESKVYEDYYNKDENQIKETIEIGMMNNLDQEERIMVQETVETAGEKVGLRRIFR